MDAMNMPSKTNNFIGQLTRDYPDFNFKPGNQDHWSPRLKTITYNPNEPPVKLLCGVLHELAHALLNHSTYSSDFELVRLEAEAWSLAAQIGKKYKVDISDEHIQNCLDTYRDWLHRRSACPTCGTHVLQKDSHSYLCYNCQAAWHVSSGRFARPYRKILKTKNA